MKSKFEILTEFLLKEKLSEDEFKVGSRRNIQIIQQVIDGNELSFEDFVSTGVFVPARKNAMYSPNVLKPNCTDVVKYVGPFFIQVLDNKGKAEYLYELFDNEESDEIHTIIRSEDLKAVEKSMWSLSANNYFNL